MIAKRLRARGSVPILVEGDRTLDDSTQIALHFEQAVGDRALLPKDEAVRARVLAEEAFFDDVAALAVRIFLYGELMRSSPAGAAKLFLDLAAERYALPSVALHVGPDDLLVRELVPLPRRRMDASLGVPRTSPASPRSSRTAPRISARRGSRRHRSSPMVG